MAATTDSETSKYSKCKAEIYVEIDKLLQAENRFQSIKERKEESVFDLDTFKKVSKG